MPGFNEEIMRPTEQFLWQLCKTYAREFPDPQRPVASELIAAFVPRVVRLLLLRHLASDVLRIARLAAEALPDRSAEIMTESGNILHGYLRELVREIVELDSWLHEPGIDEAGYPAKNPPAGQETISPKGWGGTGQLRTPMRVSATA